MACCCGSDSTQLCGISKQVTVGGPDVGNLYLNVCAAFGFGLLVKRTSVICGFIEVSGLRPGEKLYEELLCNGENSIPTDDPNIMKLKHTEIDFNKVMPDIERLTKLRHNDFYKIISLVKNIVPEFKRESDI